MVYALCFFVALAATVAGALTGMGAGVIIKPLLDAYMQTVERRPVLGIHGIVPAILVGMFLGLLSSFLGISGGPINVVLLLFVFACDIKAATPAPSSLYCSRRHPSCLCFAERFLCP